MMMDAWIWSGTLGLARRPCLWLCRGATRSRSRIASRVTGIDRESVELNVGGQRRRLANDDVFILIGSQPSLPLLRQLDVRFGGTAGAAHNPSP